MIPREVVSILSKELKLKKKPIPFPLDTIKDVELLGLEYDENTRLLFYWLYLSGQRITEALSLKRKDVWLAFEDGNDYIVVNSMTEKNKTQPRRIIPIPFFGQEKNMAKYVWERIEHLSPTESLFKSPKGKPLSRTNAWNYLARKSITITAINPQTRELMQYTMKIFPHYLRHCRASHLAMFYGYNIYQLMQFFGWSTPSVASIYATLNWKSLAKLFRK